MNEQLRLIALLFPIEIWHTLYMVVISTCIALLVGIPLGVVLTVTERGHLKESPWFNRMLGIIVNVGRSFPFAILLVALIPFPRWIVGTSLGTTAAIVPLSIAAIPFMARLAENSLKEVDRGVIEAAIVMGSTPWQVIVKVLIPEALPSLILAATTTAINLIGYSAMAGTMGGGGLGKIAIQYGYQRFDFWLMAATVLVLILLVQSVQALGHALAKHIYLKRGKGLQP